MKGKIKSGNYPEFNIENYEIENIKEKFKVIQDKIRSKIKLSGISERWSKKDEGDVILKEKTDEIFPEFMKNISLDSGIMPKAKQGKWK